jgi:hypothetical protein
VRKEVESYLKDKEDKAAAREFQQQEMGQRQAFQQQETDRREQYHREDMQQAYDLKKMMVTFGLQQKAKYMTTQERGDYEATLKAGKAADDLIKFLEQNKLTNENNMIFGPHSAFMQHIRFWAYQNGMKPEQVSQMLFQSGGTVDVLGAAPWARIGRGRYLFDTIQVHLPKPSDTPAKMYENAKWLRDHVIMDSMDALSGMVGPGGVVVGDEGAAPGAGGYTPPTVDNPPNTDVRPGQTPTAVTPKLTPRAQDYINSMQKPQAGGPR